MGSNWRAVTSSIHATAQVAPTVEGTYWRTHHGRHKLSFYPQYPDVRLSRKPTDHNLKWNVHSFEKGISSRVSYVSAVRVRPQSKPSFEKFAVRQGLAIVMEHNLMVSKAGRDNFKNQFIQLVSADLTSNDIFARFFKGSNPKLVSLLSLSVVKETYKI